MSVSVSNPVGRPSGVEAELADKEEQLLRAEEEIIKLTKRCAELMTKELKSGVEDDSWSLGSAGSLAESDSAEIRSLKEKLIKCKQNEEFLTMQLEVLQSTVKIMVHPDDLEIREKKLKAEVSELQLQLEELSAANMSMKLEISETDDVKREVARLRGTDEKKTLLIEELHEKLANYGERNSALLESLQETESSEQTLRDSLTRIRSSDQIHDSSLDDVGVNRLEEEKSRLLQRVDSLEEKESRLRGRLHQVEGDEETLKAELEKVKEELQLSNDINSSQEQTILNLQQQMIDTNSTNATQKLKSKIEELDKKSSNYKLLLSQKMEELDFSRKAITSLEKSVSKLQQSEKELEELREKVGSLNDELSLTKDVNSFQEETIKQLQTQLQDPDGRELAQSYHEQLTRQLSAEDVVEMQAEYQTELGLLKDEITMLNKKLDESVSAHQLELSSLQNSILLLKKELEQAASKTKIAQNVIDELKTQNKKLNNENRREYEEQIKDLNMKLQGEKVQNSIHRDVIASMSPQMDKLKCENEAHESCINILKEKLNMAEVDFTKKRSENDSMRSRVNFLEKKLDESKDIAQRLQTSQVLPSELEDLKHKLETKTAESDNLAVDLIEMTDKCSELEKQLNSVKSDLQSTQTQNDELHKQCEKYTMKLSVLSEESSHVVKTQEELKAKVMEFQQLENELKYSSTELSNSQAKLKGMESDYYKATSEAKKYQDFVQETSTQLAQLKEDNGKLHNKANQMQDVHLEQLKSIEKFQHENSTAMSRVAVAEFDLNAMSVKFQDSEKCCMQLVARNKETTDSYELKIHQLHQQIAELGSKNSIAVRDSETLAELQALVIVAARDIKELEKERDLLVENLNQTQSRVNDLKLAIKDYQKEIAELSEQVSMHQKQTVSMKSQIANLDSELTRCSREDERTIDSLKHQIYALTQDKTSLQNRNDELVIDVDKILSEKQVYIDEIEKLAKELKTTKSVASESDARLQTQIRELDMQLANSQRSLEQQNDNTRELYIQSEAQLQTKIQDMSKANHKFQTELDSISLQLSEVSMERDALLEKLSIENSSEADTQSENNELNRRVSEYKTQIDNLSKISKSAESVNKRLETKLDESEKARAEVVSQKTIIEAKMENLQQTLEEERNKGIYLANKQADKHRSEIETMQETLEDMSAERDELKKQLVLLKNITDETPNSATFTSQLETLKSENETLRENLVSLESEHLNQLSSSSAESCILQAQLEHMDEVIVQLNKEVKLKEDLQSLSSELQNRLRDEKKAHLQTTAELSAIKAEQMTFKEQVQDIKEKYEHSQQQCEELESEIREAVNRLKESDLENSQLSDNLVTLKGALAKESQLEAEVRRLNALLSTESSAHRGALKENDELNEQLKDEANKVKDLSDRLLSAQVEMSNLTSNTHTQELDKLKSQLEEQKAVCDLAKAASSLRVTNDDTDNDDSDDDEHQTETTNQDSYIEALQSEIKIFTGEIEFLKKENDDLSGRVADLYEQISETSQSIGDMDKLRSQNEQIVSESEHLQGRLSVANARIDELTNLLNVAESKKHLLEDELESLRANNVSLLASFGDFHQHECTNSLTATSSVQSESESVVKQQGPSTQVSNNIENLQAVIHQKEEIISDLDTSMIAAESRVATLMSQLEERDSEFAALETKVQMLQKQLDITLTEDSEDDNSDYKSKYQQVQNQIDELKADYLSLETIVQETTDSKIQMGLQIASLKDERDRLNAQVRASPRMDENNTDAVEYRGLQRQIIELKQQLQAQRKCSEDLEKEKIAFDERLQFEKTAAKNAMDETQKLEMSITMLMTSHQVEMSSLQTALHEANYKMGELEVKVTSHSQHTSSLRSLISKVNAELQDIKAAKDAVGKMMKDLIAQNSEASIQLHQHISQFVQQQQDFHDTSAEEGTSDLSITFPVDPPYHSSTLRDLDTSHNSQSNVSHLLSSQPLSSIKTESLATVSHYGKLSKEELVAKLSDQTKHELILRKNLQEARQSLMFYRSAIDNIIDCMGTAMPDVKKWANDFLNSEDQTFSQHLDALISNESALQRRCHALEISEKALTDNFETKEREYQMAIQRLEDMMSILKSSNSKLTEDLKLKTSSVSLGTEQQISDLKDKVYELEVTVRKLRIQNEEIQFAYEQECERRQLQEEERFKADQRSRLSTVEVVRETEYLSKIASLENKIANLLRTQKHLEATIEDLKHDSHEEDLKLQIETLERSERALHRKIEILQQSDIRGNSTQYDNNLDQPEDLLRQRIWEMEKMEIHLKQQVSDLEHDREELHEIARSDKNIIHELHIQLAESGLANKNLKTQVTRLEHAEEIMYTKLENAETRISELEEKLKEALNNEKTMRYQLEDIEYSEDNLRFRTGNMEQTLETFQANETTLKKTIDDLTNERQQAVKDLSSWKSRLKELEADHGLLKNQLVETENREIMLKGKISELAAIEASLQTRIREVELDNERLTSKTLHMERNAATIRDNLSDTFMSKDELNTQIQSMKSTEMELKSRISNLETENFELEKRLQDVNFNHIQLQSQQNLNNVGEARIGDRLVTALANEKQAKSQIAKLEAVVAAYESRQTSGIVERENFQLNAENKNLKEKLKTKERDLREVEEKVARLTAAGNTTGGTYRINKLQAEVKDLQTQLKVSEENRRSLEQMLQKPKVGNGTVSCGHEVEIARMKAELSHLKELNSQKPHRKYPEAMGMISDSLASKLPPKHEKKRQGQPQDSLRTQCLRELMTKVNQKTKQERSDPPADDADQAPIQQSSHDMDDGESMASDDAAEIASQSSIWEKLEPPIRRSPRPVMSAALIKPPSPPTVPAILISQRPSPSVSDVPEESSLWDNLELYEPKKSDFKRVPKVEIVFDEGPIAPVYCPRKSLVLSALNFASSESADEVSDIEQEVLAPVEVCKTHSPLSDKMESSKQSPAFSTLSAQAALLVETKDIARLKQAVVDLERRLKSRETEIRMLRNGQKEIERDSNLSGDVYTMKTKLKTLQDQKDAAETRISTLRNELISRDKNLTNRQREIVELRLELRKLKEAESPTKPVQLSTEVSILSSAVSPGRQRPIQMSSSPGRQTTVEQDPVTLYKSMIESKDSHIKDLSQRLEEKSSAIAKLERDLTDVKVAVACPTDPNAAKFKYLDDRYTEAATKCYNMKLEKDEWKKKYDDLVLVHSKCQQSSDEKCSKCKLLKREIRRLQKELDASRRKLVRKDLDSGSSNPKATRHTNGASDHALILSETTNSYSQSDVSLSSQTDQKSTQNIISSGNSGVTDGISQHSKLLHSPPTKIPTDFKVRTYDVVSDYNPQYFSTSGRIAQEIPLKQGQRLRVIEQADDTGYCRAEVNSKLYLVPMKYLQLIDTDKLEVGQKSKYVISGLTQSSEYPTHHPDLRANGPVWLSTSQPVPVQQSYNVRTLSPLRHTAPAALAESRSLSPLRHTALAALPESSYRPSSSITLSSKPSVELKQKRKPRPPVNLAVEIVANQKVYVEWNYAGYLDHNGRSNGTTVTGFRVFLNGRSTKDVASPYTTRTSINVDRGQLVDLHTVSVQTLGASNINSTLTHVTVSPYLETNNTQKVTNSSPGRLQREDKSAKRRLFMAYYDYDPVKQSPYSRGYKATCNDELPLKTGDFVIVQGEPKANGFYLAEINGRTGYVPEAFVRQVPAENAKHFGFHENNVYLH